MQFPGEPRRSAGVLRQARQSVTIICYNRLNTCVQSAWTIYLANSGHWELQEDGYSLGYQNTAPGCGQLLGSQDPGLWRYSSNTGFTMQIRLGFVEALNWI